MAKPYEVDSWTKFRAAAREYLKAAQRNLTGEAAPERKPKLDKATRDAMNEAKVSPEEQRNFLAMCKNNPQLAASLHFLARKNMERARRFAVAFTSHYERVDNSIAKMLAPKDPEPGEEW